ncbi:MAG: hypothetical protein AB1797_12690 [bacterium]
MLDPRCSIFDAGKGFSIQDRGSRLCLCALVAERLLKSNRSATKARRHERVVSWWLNTYNFPC